MNEFVVSHDLTLLLLLYYKNKALVRLIVLSVPVRDFFDLFFMLFLPAKFDLFVIKRVNFRAKQQNIHTKINPEHRKHNCRKGTIHGKSIKVSYINRYPDRKQIPDNRTQYCSRQLIVKIYLMSDDRFAVWQRIKSHHDDQYHHRRNDQYSKIEYFRHHTANNRQIID